MDNVLRWQIQCHSEWCAGPETFEVRKTKPIEEYIACPVCGWHSKLGSGYKPIYDEEVTGKEE